MSDMPYDTEKARRHLERVDERMAVAIEAVGPFSGSYRPADDPFIALAEAIAYQQLSGKAAATIFGRFEQLAGPNEPMTARIVLQLDIEDLRSAGLSGAKARAIRHLAELVLDGTIPDMTEFHTLENETVIERLTQVTGIGPWTAHMFLMSRLGRPDIFAPGDLGLRKGIQRIDDLEDLPSPGQAARRAEVWSPYRSMASWYLWRVLDIDAPGMD